MSRGVRLGRIAGVEVRLDWSLLIIFWLIVLSLATGVFPASLPGRPPALDWALAVAAAVLFYASLLAHELAHSLIARRRGVTVEGITLWLLGGVSQLHGEVQTPGDELRVTAVGPLVTLALALVFGVLAGVLGAAGAGDAVLILPAWLSFMNLLLGTFNLLPAYPLDGGRILHALIWRHRGDRGRATETAARMGRAFGMVLITLGILEFFALATLGGLWFVFLGWFVVSAARAEEFQSRARSTLAGVRVGDVMSRDPVVVPDWITIDVFLHDMVLAHRFSFFPVHEPGGRLTGVVSVRRLGVVPRGARAEKRIRDVATPIADAIRTSPDEQLIDLMPRMQQSHDGRALVFEGDQLVGIVSSSDIARSLQVASLNRG